MTVTVGDIVRVLDEAFPFSWAESWDNVGLVVGEPSAVAEHVLVSLDADPATLERAERLGADVLVTHHPPFLDTPKAVTPESAPALWLAASRGISVITAHTNLDRSPQASGVLLDMLGLDSGEPIENTTAEETLITVYTPVDTAEEIRTVLSDAGAGRISTYEECSFTGVGEGRFTPRDDASPVADTGGSFVSELRIEAVAPSSAADAVVRRVAAAHPYEEPLITVTPIRRARGAVALGRVAEIETTSLGELVEKTVAAFDCTPRVWGDPASPVTRVATATGSASSLVPAAIASGAGALLAGEVRYHEALDAMNSGLAIIEAGHDVTEWPLVPVLARQIATLQGMDGSITVEGPTRSWWTP